MQNIYSRLRKLEIIEGTDEEIFIHIGIPCFTLKGTEAKEHIHREQAAGRLLNGSNSGSGFIVHRSKYREEISK